jgi:hypothetical protein
MLLENTAFFFIHWLGVGLVVDPMLHYCDHMIILPPYAKFDQSGRMWSMHNL